MFLSSNWWVIVNSDLFRFKVKFPTRAIFPNWFVFPNKKSCFQLSFGLSYVSKLTFYPTGPRVQGPRVRTEYRSRGFMVTWNAITWYKWTTLTDTIFDRKRDLEPTVDWQSQFKDRWLKAWEPIRIISNHDSLLSRLWVIYRSNM